MIFAGREEEGWEFFNEYFPILCRKEKSKEFILETKQKVMEMRI